jgi:hypothetical protein
MDFRIIERSGFCRGCDKVLPKGENIFYTYSHRNCGQSIIFCMDCVGKIAKKYNAVFPDKSCEYVMKISEITIMIYARIKELENNFSNPNIAWDQYKQEELDKLIAMKEIRYI